MTCPDGVIGKGRVISLLLAALFADRLWGRKGWSAARAQSRIPARTDLPSTGRSCRSHQN